MSASGSSSGRRGGAAAAKKKLAEVTAAQKKKIQELCGIVSCSSRQAQQYLERNRWDLAQAADAFFTNPPAVIEPPDAASSPPHQPPFSTQKIEQLYDSFASKENVPVHRVGVDSVMDEDGIQAFLSQCGISEDDESSEHLFAWRCGAIEMGVLTRTEFIKGMTALSCDTPGNVLKNLRKVREQLAETASFTSFYGFLYDYVRGPTRRSIDVDEAIMVWQMWLTPDRPQTFHHLPRFIQWLQSGIPQDPITKDLWTQLLLFFMNVDDALSSYDPNDAWPVRIDEFVEWLKEQK